VLVAFYSGEHVRLWRRSSLQSVDSNAKGVDLVVQGMLLLLLLLLLLPLRCGQLLSLTFLWVWSDG
jgi:hypothetical protein